MIQPKFSPAHNAIMWISTKGFFLEDERNIINLIRQEIKQLELETKEKISIIFTGYCFGRFDLIVEFQHNSAKVASNTVCYLQEKIRNELENKKSPDPICSSLTIGNKVIFNNSNSKTDTKCPLRTYTFLRPKTNNMDLTKVSDKLKQNMELFWTSSSYTFLLTMNGLKFHRMFKDIVDFRAKTEQYFSESCTYVGLRFETEDEENREPINALTFVKLKGFGDFDLKENEESDWNDPEKRLGWSDICLTPKNKHKLIDLKMAILKLRETHQDEIFSTSTLLLPKEEES